MCEFFELLVTVPQILTDEFGGETDLVRDELHHLGRRGFTVEQWPPRVVQIRQHYGTSQPIVVAAAPIDQIEVGGG